MFVLPDLGIAELWDNIFTSDETIEGQTATSIATSTAQINANSAAAIAAQNAQTTMTIVYVFGGVLGLGILLWFVTKIIE